MQTLEQTVNLSYEWALDRIYELSYTDEASAKSIEDEFYEWLDTSEDYYDVCSINYLGDY